jgi:integrase
MTGNITRRGTNSWRLKFDTDRDPDTGKRVIRYATVRGTKKQAQMELTRMLASRDEGTLVKPIKVTVADYLRHWLSTAAVLSISPKTAERYSQLIENQIIPHLGAYPLQKLDTEHIEAWHATLLTQGGQHGKPLATRTVGHAHRVLHKALANAAKHRKVLRNPASLERPPKVAPKEKDILKADQVQKVVTAMRDTVIYPQIVLLLSTGMRRGELMGLQWGDIDLETRKLTIKRAVEKTKAHGLRIKTPKTAYGTRQITLPDAAVTVLKQHRKNQLEQRMALGTGRLPDDAYLFGTIEGRPRDPDRLTQDWKRFTAARKLPKVTLHALRHSHASALIAAGTDPVTVSQRLGHASAAFTMATYVHEFDKGDEAAAEAIDAVFSVEK